MMAKYRNVAHVVKSHGKAGEVVAVPADGLPFVMREGLRVALVPPSLREDRWHVLEGVSSRPSGQLVRLSGVRDLESARACVGRSVLVREDDLPAGFMLHDVPRLLGREVADVTLGPLGTIREVMTGPANDVWAVCGPAGETLVPVVDEVVDDVPEAGPIVVSLPDGLVGAGASS